MFENSNTSANGYVSADMSQDSCTQLVSLTRPLDSSPESAMPPTSLPYAEVVRRAIADPCLPSSTKPQKPWCRRLEDRVAYPILSESKSQATRDPKRASRYHSHQLHSVLHDQQYQREQEFEGLEASRGGTETSTNFQRKLEVSKEEQRVQPVEMSEKLTEHTLEALNADEIPHGLSELSTGASHAEENQQYFLEHIKTTLSIEHCSGDGLQDEEFGSKQDSHTTNKYSLDAEQSRQENCRAQFFFPKHKLFNVPQPASPLSAISVAKDFSYSSPPSPSTQRSALKTSSAPSTPRYGMASEVAAMESGKVSGSSSGTTTPVPVAGTKEELQGIIMGGPALSPARQGTYATLRNAEVVEHQGAQSVYGVIGVAGDIPVTGESEQCQAPKYRSRPSVPYSPPIYETESTHSVCPDPGCMPHHFIATAGRMSHVAIPVETLGQLFGQIAVLSRELGFVRAEIQAQTFQLQQLTAHVNQLHGLNHSTQPQILVPTPTAAYRTPPSTILGHYQMHQNGGSPTQGGYQQPSEVTDRHNGFQVSNSHGSANGVHQSLRVPAPISKSSLNGTLEGLAARRNPSSPIVFGEFNKEVSSDIKLSPAVTFRQARLPQNLVQEPHPEPKAAIARADTRHRRSSSTPSQQNSSPLTPVVLPLRGVNHDRPTYYHSEQHSEVGHIIPRTQFGGTWGGTRNWYHQAYGNDLV